MKSIMITFDQAYNERIVELLDRMNCRGFTRWEQVQGRGSKTGEPHYGSHAWPSMCSAIMTVVDDHKVQPLLDKLHEIGSGNRDARSACLCLERGTVHLIFSSCSDKSHGKSPVGFVVTLCFFRPRDVL